MILFVNKIIECSNSMSNQAPKPLKKKRKRCNHTSCHKKLKLSNIRCRCKHRFCAHHRLPEQHECSYNFKNETKEAFMKRVGLGGGEVCKLEVI